MKKLVLSVFTLVVALSSISFAKSTSNGVTAKDLFGYEPAVTNTKRENAVSTNDIKVERSVWEKMPDELKSKISADQIIDNASEVSDGNGDDSNYDDTYEDYDDDYDDDYGEIPEDYSNASNMVVETTKLAPKNGWYGDYYYQNDVPVKNTWEEYNGEWYYCGPNGEILKNQWIENTYYVDSEGKMLRNTTTPTGNKVGADGKYIPDEVIDLNDRVDNSVDYKDLNVKNYTVINPVTDKTVYFNSFGKYRVIRATALRKVRNRSTDFYKAFKIDDIVDVVGFDSDLKMGLVKYGDNYGYILMEHLEKYDVKEYVGSLKPGRYMIPDYPAIYYKNAYNGDMWGTATNGVIDILGQVNDKYVAIPFASEMVLYVEIDKIKEYDPAAFEEKVPYETGMYFAFRDSDNSATIKLSENIVKSITVDKKSDGWFGKKHYFVKINLDLYGKETLIEECLKIKHIYGFNKLTMVDSGVRNNEYTIDDIEFEETVLFHPEILKLYVKDKKTAEKLAKNIQNELKDTYNLVIDYVPEE